MKRQLQIVLASGAVALALFSGVQARAETGVPWRTSTYQFRAHDLALKELFEQYAAIQGVRTVVSDAVKGRISGKFDNIPPEQFLEQMASANGLVYFFDGSALYVSDASEVSGRVVQLPQRVAEQTQKILEQIGVSRNGYELRKVDSDGTLYVTGPPRLFEMINEIASDIDSRKDQLVVKIFPLKYAWAYDLQFAYRDQQVTVPGVASALREIMSGGDGAVDGASALGGAIGAPSSTVQKLKGQGLIKMSKSNGTSSKSSSSSSTTSAAAAATPPAQASAASSGSEQMIHADVRLNTVVVRDTRERIAQYADLVAALDKPVRIIEITAAIIDVSTDKISELGNDFMIRKTQPNGGFVGAGFDGNPGGGTDRTPSSGTGQQKGFNFNPGGPAVNGLAGALAQSGGFNFSTLIVNSGWEFLSRVHALEAKGEAKILSRPSVLTLDNVEAVVRNDETFYVRVAGDQEVDLFNVTAGVELKVTPRISEGGDDSKVQLVVNIVDGNFTDKTVDNIPVVRESSISTQATVKENQSLLVGGYMREEDTKEMRATPLLGKVPLFGYLFKREDKSRTKVERMFLITPRIVNLNLEPSKGLTDKYDTSQNPAFGPEVVPAQLILPTNEVAPTTLLLPPGSKVTPLPPVAPVEPAATVPAPQVKPLPDVAPPSVEASVREVSARPVDAHAVPKF